MQVKEAMTKNPEVITPDTTLQEAARIMRECDCGYLPVGENDRLIGAVTDRDIVIRAIAEGRSPETPVREIMTRRIEYCFEKDDLEEAGEHMKDKQIRRLVVLNDNKRLTGVLSIGDVANQDTDLVGDIEGEVCQKMAA